MAAIDPSVRAKLVERRDTLVPVIASAKELAGHDEHRANSLRSTIAGMEEELALIDAALRIN